MSESSRMNINFQIPGDQQKPKKPQPKIITLEQALNYIKLRNFEPELYQELVKRISRYPANSLNMAMKNLSKMVVEITQKLREERNNAEQKPDGIDQSSYETYKDHPFFQQKEREDGAEEDGSPAV